MMDRVVYLNIHSILCSGGILLGGVGNDLLGSRVHDVQGLLFGDSLG